MVAIRKRAAESMMDLIVLFDNPENWNDQGRHCIRCAKKIQGVSCTIPTGKICISCAEAMYRDFAGQQEIAAWHHSRFIHILSGHESLRWRITVLTRYGEAVEIANAQKTSDVGSLHRALVVNLGCMIDHPLNRSIRQMAVHAVVQAGKPMLPILLEYRNKQHPWQFYFNIVLCASTIGPDDPKVQQLLENAIEHPVDMVRNKILSIISNQKSSWAKKFLEKLNNRGVAAGMVRVESEADTQKPQEQKQIIAAEPARMYEIPEQLTPLESAIMEIYSNDSLKAIYSKYLASLFCETCFPIKRGAFSVSKLTKRQLVWALGQAFSQKDKFEQLLKNLPTGVAHVLNLLTWEKGGVSIQAFPEPIDPPIVIESVETIAGGRKHTTKKLNPDYVIIPSRNIKSYLYYFDPQNNLLYLPDSFRNEFKKFLPSPEEYHLTALDTIEKTDFIYADGNDFLNHIHLICTYIAQGNLRYAKNGKILKTSLKEMAAYCHIQEFFQENPDNTYLKTGLIIDFIDKQSVSEKQSTQEFLKQVFDVFFTKVPTYDGFFLNRFVFHLKGAHNLIGGYHGQSHQKNELNVRSSLRNLLRSLAPGQWYSVEKLIDYCRYRDMDLEIVNRSFAASYLSVDVRDDSLRYEKYRTESISDMIYRDALEIPFFKGVMFFLATFGMVDLAYDSPRNERIQKKGLDYLSVFDGARYIRLTPLGAYIVGTAKDFSFNEERESANLELDDKRLLITLDGKDRLRSMILGQIAERISENCFKVSSGSFLKSCATLEDIKNKISLFRKEISARPPRIWEDFLKDIQGKINPLIPEPDMHVFRLKDHPELIELMAMDEVLQRLILKAEDYHVIISSRDINLVRKRLETFGYLIDPIR